VHRLLLLEEIGAIVGTEAQSPVKFGRPPLHFATRFSFSALALFNLAGRRMLLTLGTPKPFVLTK
jgi:hypothetical protein